MSTKRKTFDEPEGSPPPAITRVEPGEHNWLVHRDLATDVSTLEVINDDGSYVLDNIGLRIGKTVRERYTSRGDEFTSLRAESESLRCLERDDWSVRVVTRTVLTSSREEFCIRADLDAYDGDRRFYCQSWDRIVRRHFV